MIINCNIQSFSYNQNLFFLFILIWSDYLVWFSDSKTVLTVTLDILDASRLPSSIMSYLKITLKDYNNQADLWTPPGDRDTSLQS